MDRTNETGKAGETVPAGPAGVSAPSSDANGDGTGEIRAAEAEAVKRRDSFSVRLRYVLHKDRLGQTALVFLVLVVLAAVVGPVVMGDASTHADLGKRFIAPFHLHEGFSYFLGSDALGRSFLARLLVAARTTAIIAVLAVVASAVVGSLIGTVVGYVGGRLEAYVMRIADVMQAFPSLMLALIILYTVGPGLGPLIFVLALSKVQAYIRVARAETLAVRERLFVTAARALGAGPIRIVLRQIAPVVAPSLVGLATLEFALVILSESALSFLGLGVQEPDITWGGLISEGRNYLSDAWWVALLPGLAITLTAVSVNVIADVVRRTTQSD